MEKSSIEQIVRALNEHQVRYLIVGGLAVVAHGYVRFTADVDIVLAFDETNLASAIQSFEKLQYSPRVPVAITEFLDAENRRQWAVDRHMTVFSLFSAAHAATEIDLFVESPFDFESAYANAARLEVAPGVLATFCSVIDLIALKARAGRANDLDDIAQLRHIISKEA